MAQLSSGIFTLSEFMGRHVLKLAPDMFVVVNGALGSSVVAPVNSGGRQNLEVRGGITSVNVTTAVKPAGANRATIEIIAPMYKGLHQDYYVTLPNGTRIPIISAMMEVQVYMKGRYLKHESETDKPKYYPVFWGMVTDVSESYSGGVFSLSVTCGDLLSWWKYQKITINPSVVQPQFGGPVGKRVPTVFENMNPWEIIYSLFMDNYFVQMDGEEGKKRKRVFNFLYPKYSKSGFLPNFGLNKDFEETFSAIAQNIISYWNNRFGFNIEENSTDPQRVPLEMFGLNGRVSIKDIRAMVLKGKSRRTADMKAQLTLDYNILSRIQPFGALTKWGDGAEPVVNSKLEIANEVCEQTHMEFFADTNGSIVFKPPFYNLDVQNYSIPEYRIDPQDIINFNASFSSDKIVNWLECTAPQYYHTPDLEVIGYHMDWESIKRYGVRYQSAAMRYGNDARTLRMIAVAEMARINGAAYTGSVTIPLRPELRMGYPVYLKHIDAYYYVTSIQHSFSYGSEANTTLSLEFRRDRVFDDGSVTDLPGRLLAGYVHRFKKKYFPTLDDKRTPDQKAADVDAMFKEASDQDPGRDLRKESLRDQFLRNSKLLDGPKSTGFYELDKAAKKVQVNAEVKDSDNPSAYVSNELVMITDDTVPYTDIRGYKHIGAFPYGANLILFSTSNLVCQRGSTKAVNAQIEEALKASGLDVQTPLRSDESDGTPPNSLDCGKQSDLDVPYEVKTKEHTERTQELKDVEDSQASNADPPIQADNNGRGPKDKGLNAAAKITKQVSGMQNANGDN